MVHRLPSMLTIFFSVNFDVSKFKLEQVAFELLLFRENLFSKTEIFITTEHFLSSKKLSKNLIKFIMKGENY